jgi:hypothetical protein
MNTKFAATALILASGLIAGTSFAAESGALTREQVRATVLQARAEGSMPQNTEVQVIDYSSIPSTTTREAVQSEYLAARKNGTLPKQSAAAAVALMSGHSDAATPSTLTREAVTAEFLAARKNGTLPKQGVNGVPGFSA